MYNTVGHFVSNNVKGIRFSERKLKIFEDLKNNRHHNGFVFLQETHSITEDEKKWKEDFKDPSLFHMIVQILVE